MEVNCFQILLIYVTFYVYHVQKVVHNDLIKKWKPEYMRHRRLKGLEWCLLCVTVIIFLYGWSTYWVIYNSIKNDKSPGKSAAQKSADLVRSCQTRRRVLQESGEKCVGGRGGGGVWNNYQMSALKFRKNMSPNCRHPPAPPILSYSEVERKNVLSQ